MYCFYDVLPQGLKPYSTLYPFIPGSHVQSWVVRLEIIMDFDHRHFGNIRKTTYWNIFNGIRKFIRPLKQ